MDTGGDLPPLLLPPPPSSAGSVSRNASASGNVAWPAAATEATTPAVGSGPSFADGVFAGGMSSAMSSAPAQQPPMDDSGGVDLADRVSIRSGYSGSGLLPTVKRLHDTSSQISLPAGNGPTVPSAVDDDDDDEGDQGSRGADNFDTGSIVGAAYAAAAQVAMDNSYNEVHPCTLRDDRAK